MSEIVEYDPLVSFLKQATPFEIYRVTTALQNELDNPMRLAPISAAIQVGDLIEYYDVGTNTLIKAMIIDKKAKKVVVKHIHDGRVWRIPLYLLKLESRDFVFEEKEKGLNKNSVKVGDLVGFYHQTLAKHITGQVIRLNTKTVTLRTTAQNRWRVSYKLLYAVIDGDNFMKDAESTALIGHSEL